jgi:hypothetical protein
MPSMNKLSSYKTTIASDGTHTVVTYQKTQIVRWNDAEIILDFGGWDSVTTRRKMNQASNQFILGYTVYREKEETYVQPHGVLDREVPRIAYDGSKIVIDRKTGERVQMP